MSNVNASQVQHSPAASITHDFELSIENSSTERHPDHIQVVFHENLLHRIARSMLAIHASGEPYCELIIPLADDLAMFEDGVPYLVDDEGDGADFRASSTWLKIQNRSLAIEIWDEVGDDELHGSESIANITGLVAGIARHLAVAMTEFQAVVSSPPALPHEGAARPTDDEVVLQVVNDVNALLKQGLVESSEQSIREAVERYLASLGASFQEAQIKRTCELIQPAREAD